LDRTIYNATNNKPIEYSQDYFRCDYARIHMDIELYGLLKKAQSQEEHKKGIIPTGIERRSSEINKIA